MRDRITLLIIICQMRYILTKEAKINRLNCSLSMANFCPNKWVHLNQPTPTLHRNLISPRRDSIINSYRVTFINKGEGVQHGRYRMYLL